MIRRKSGLAEINGRKNTYKNAKDEQGYSENNLKE